ncbi:MAG: hypothetical protein EP332_08860 [Bacteroidetes bacterium]|nr:MAG: hypothetical protein EP332_08860 [Bacteroidota bacterium]
MKKIIASLSIASLICIAFLSISAQKQLDRLEEDIFTTLQIPAWEGKLRIRENIIREYLSLPNQPSLKMTPVEKRAELVKRLGAEIKKDINSLEFAASYKQYLEENQPQRPKGQDIAERIAELKKEIKTMEADREAADDEYKPLYDMTIAELKKEMEIIQNPNHPEYSLYVVQVGMSPEEQAQFMNDSIEFAKINPPLVKDMVKLRLEAFLAFTADIPFDANLVERNGKKYFVKEELEAKSSDWKQCFRAGKETIQAGRNFAEAWLKELKQ